MSWRIVLDGLLYKKKCCRWFSFSTVCLPRTWFHWVHDDLSFDKSNMFCSNNGESNHDQHWMVWQCIMTLWQLWRLHNWFRVRRDIRSWQVLNQRKVTVNRPNLGRSNPHFAAVRYMLLKGSLMFGWFNPNSGEVIPYPFITGFKLMSLPLRLWLWCQQESTKDVNKHPELIIVFSQQPLFGEISNWIPLVPSPTTNGLGTSQFFGWLSLKICSNSNQFGEVVLVSIQFPRSTSQWWLNLS